MGQDFKQAMDWLHKNDPNPEVIEDDALRTLAKIASVALPWGKLTPLSKRRGLHYIVEWFRDFNDLASDDLDGPTMQALVNLAGLDSEMTLSAPNKQKNTFKQGENLTAFQVPQTLQVLLWKGGCCQKIRGIV